MRVKEDAGNHKRSLRAGVGDISEGVNHPSIPPSIHPSNHPSIQPTNHAAIIHPIIHSFNHPTNHIPIQPTLHPSNQPSNHHPACQPSSPLTTRSQIAHRGDMVLQGLTNQYLAPVSSVAQAVSDGDLQSYMKVLPQEEPRAPGSQIRKRDENTRGYLTTSDRRGCPGQLSLWHPGKELTVGHNHSWVS